MSAPTVPRPTFIPAIVYKDRPAALEWLQRAFGFEVSELLTDADDNIVAVPVQIAGSITLGTPRVVVAARAFGTSRPSALDVSPDGSKLFVLLDSSVRSVGLVVGWQDQLR